VEADVAREQTVRGDDQATLARFEVQENLPLLARTAEAAQHFDADGKRGEAPAKRFVVLEDEDGGRREQRNLLGIGDRFKSRAHANFGLALAHVAAQKAVHRQRALHVPLDIGNGVRLVGGLVEFERVLKLALPGRVRRKSQAAGCLSLRVEAEQLLRHVLERFADPRFARRPGRAAQPVQYRCAALARAEAVAGVYAFEYQIKSSVVGILTERE